MSPFDAARYALLLEGLETAEIPVGQLEFSGRLDAEYYRPLHLRAEKAVREKGGKPLASLCDFVIGPFGSAFNTDRYTDDPTYRYIRGKDVKQMELTEDDNVYMPEDDFTRLAKYALRAGDVLVSVVGTLGNSALVEPQHVPAIFSCKSTALRVHGVDPKYLIAYLNSGYGRELLVRKERGAVQKGLNLDDLKSLLVFVAGETLQKEVADVHLTATKAKRASMQCLADAENTLLRELRLEHWQAPEPLTYVRSSLDALTACRLDAEFFTPRVRALLERLGRDGLTLADVAPARHEAFKPEDAGETFRYIEIGDMRGDGSVGAMVLATRDAPSRATQIVRGGDVLTSTVRPIRRLSALINADQDGAVCSSGFVVLRPEGISGAALLTYLRLPLVCELMNLHTSASLYPAISERDLLGLPIPSIPELTQKVIEAQVLAARAARQRASQLLEAAKRAVEIAIEDSETAALAYLRAVTAAEQVSGEFLSPI